MKLDIQHIKRMQGIYILSKEDEVVYIGKSKNCYTRILEHLYENKKDFDKVSAFYHSSLTQIEVAEVYLIDYLNPRYNILKTNFKTFWRTLPTIAKKELGFPSEDKILASMEKALNAYYKAIELSNNWEV